MLTDEIQTLSPQDTARLTEFARACKAAARAVVLYPDGHPAVGATLGRIVQVTANSVLPAPLQIGVLADGLRLEGRAAARPDPALAELATLLHGHLVAALTIQPGGDAEAWKAFLRLLGRAPEEVRAEGGIARLWASVASRHVEVTEIDYSEVLRERDGTLPAGWDDIIASCLQSQTPDLDEHTTKILLEIAHSSERLSEMIAILEARIEEGGGGLKSRAAAVMQLIESLVAAVQQRDPGALDAVMQQVSDAVARLSPDLVLALLTNRDGGDSRAAQLATSVVEHMSDASVAGFVARHACAEHTATDRLAQAFHALVRDAEDKERLVALAHDEAAQLPFGQLKEFESAWDQVAERLLTSYSDEPFVSDDYARELSSTRSRAKSVEQTGDDPPERIANWLGSVSTNELRLLDVALMTDLLDARQDTALREQMVTPLVSLLEDLLLLGDFEAALALLRVAQTPRDGHAPVSAQVAERLVAGPMITHVLAHLSTVDDERFECIKTFCIAVGEGLIGPLAEALSAEERSRARERLTAIFMAFGASGRREVERLKNSPNPGVRRAAVSLLREFGGKEALPELMELLRDSEPQVQREAVRAILNIGTERAYAVLEKALTQGTDQSRDAIMQSLSGAREERAAPLFAYILNHVDPRGALREIYVRSIEALGTLRDPAGVPALTAALYRGEWWAPGRTAALRSAAASALTKIGTPEATLVLEEASASGSRGVRAAVRRAKGRT